MNNDLILYIIPWALLALTVLVFLIEIKSSKSSSQKKQEQMDHKMFELAILKELGDRVGYSLDVHQIIDVITGSLHQFIEYSAVSYMLLDPEKVLFKVMLEKSVSRKFINEIRDRMLKSLSALLDREFKQVSVEEVISGAILVNDVEKPVQSFFNIPLVIGGKVVGILTISDINPGLYKEEEMTILYKITQQASDAVTKLQDVVRTEERKLNSMVESMPDGVVMTDKDYRIVVVNPSIVNVLGLDNKKELTIFDFIDNLGGKFDIRGKLEESIKLDKILEIPEVLIGEKFFQLIVSPVKSNAIMTKGQILGGVVVFHDITKEKELEELRKDFTSMMVHELRSPLDGIHKITDLIMRKKKAIKAGAITGEYIPIIYKSSGDMLLLVNKLLDAAKIESGKYEVNQTVNDIKTLLINRIKFYEPSAIDAKMKITNQISQNIPEKITFDQNAISEVLNNFISNALRYNREDGTITIQAIFHKKDNDILKEAHDNGIEWFIKENNSNLSSLPDSLIVSVTDNGLGIKQENIPLLFNKFRQFNTSTLSRDKKGTGLGLVVSKGIVEAHGGIIGVASKEGSGSTFYFSIPIKEITINK